MEDRGKAIKEVITYVLLTFALSIIFYIPMVSTRSMNIYGGYGVLGLMWCPGLAAIAVNLLYRRTLRGMGWRPGDVRYLIWSYGIPILYGTVLYTAVWFSGLGGFKTGFPMQDLPQIILVGTVFGIISAAGEEIGWRGLLVPRLFNLTSSFTKTCLITGLIWASWHYPGLIFADYNAGTPAVFGLLMFTLIVVEITFVMSWLRLRSGSLWTGVLFHTSHNLFIQDVFNPLTIDTGYTRYITGEFGIGLVILGLVMAFIAYSKRSELTAPGKDQTIPASLEISPQVR
ncbi:MAG TPA: type II CAAX endopeptidase family protein [Methanotrichaceae archaeon]|nr:type II CAAX endopeptidase family protein [Methanotrichaceae archaeon]